MLNSFSSLNSSFYSSTKTISYATFVPRIKLPTLFNNQADQQPPRNQNQLQQYRPTKSLYRSPSRDSQGNPKPSRQMPTTLVDYDEYDAQVFKPTPQGTCSAK